MIQKKNQNYKVLILNPPRVDGCSVVREERFEHKDIGAVYPPLNLLYVAGVVEREGYAIKLVDANGFDLSVDDVLLECEDFKPDVVVSRFAFDTWKQDLEVFKKIKNKFNCKIVLRNKIFGDVASLRSEVVLLEYVDVFINSEPEAVIVDLIGAFQNKLALKNVKGICYFDKKVVCTSDVESINDLDILPFPAYHLLPSLKPYHTGIFHKDFALITTTRGCPFSCTFCAFGNGDYRVRKVDEVIRELLWLKNKFGVKNVLFFDDTSSLKKGRLEEICKKMIENKLNMKWSCCTRANTINENLLTLMKDAGCEEIAFGIESGSEIILKNIKKGVTKEDIRVAARLCKKVGILFYGLVIIGLPGETEETIKETVDFIKEIDPFYTQFCFAVPFPNTEIYKYAKEKDYLLTEDWGDYCPLNSEPVMRTEELSKEDLIRLRRKVYVQLLFRPLYLIKKIRLSDPKWTWDCFIKFLDRAKSVIIKGRIR